ncbi:CynX/NimT family MFS transporter [Chloroflexota bacterium]
MHRSNNNIRIEPYLKSYRWIILAIVWLLYAAFGLNVRSMPPVVTPILSDLKMSYGEMGFILGSWQLVYIPVSIMAGIAMDRWGIRKSLFLGTVIMALSEGLRYFATGFVTLLPIVALFGIGGPLISIGAPKAISVWFRGNDRATAVGIYTTAPWIGGLFAIAATNSLVMPLMGYSWRLTFAFYSLVTMVFASIWWLFARDVNQTDDLTKTSIKDVFTRLIGVSNVRIILLAGLLTMFIEHGFSHWLPKMLENGGFSPEVAGFMASIPLIAAIPSVLFLPRLVPRHLRGRFLALLAFLISVALLLFLTASSWVLQAGLILYGVAAPSLLPMLMLILMDDPQVGSEHMGLAGGIFFAVAEIGGFTGPLLMGIMVDVTGAFLVGVSFLAGVGLILCAAAFFLREHE